MPGCLGINFVEMQKPLLHGVMKSAGLQNKFLEIEQGTTLACWLPKKQCQNKPALLLLHGFAAEGAVTWQFQVGSLSKHYSLYVPDLLFFGKSHTVRSERTLDIQAECIVKMLRILGVERCMAVGFSYGGMVAYKVAEAQPELISCLVISGASVPMTSETNKETLHRIGYPDSKELLLPTSAKGLRTLLHVACHKKLWFPLCLFKDFLEVMFQNRNERAELLSALVESEAQVPKLSQRVVLLWGAEDQIFNKDQAEKTRQHLGEKAELILIEKAGHLVQLERPCRFNKTLLKCLKGSD